MIRCTIAIPLYNGETFIRASVQSALDATSGDDEVLVIDNASTDRSREVLQEFISRLPEPSRKRIRVERNSANIGLFPNFNRCVEMARGEFVKILCADDLIVSGFLNLEVELLRNHPAMVMTNSPGLLIDENNQTIATIGNEIPPGIYIGTTLIPKLLRFHGRSGWNPFCYFAGILLRREAFVEIGGFNCGMKKSADIELFYRLLARGTFAVTNFLSCRITRHSQQMGLVGISSGNDTKELFLVVDENRKFFPTPSEFFKTRTEFGALVLFYGIKFLARGNFAAFRSYFEIAHRESGFALIFAEFSFLWRKFFEKINGRKQKLVL